MSAIAYITLADALPTPVNHVFKPVTHNDKMFVWRDSTTGLTVASAPTIELIKLPSRDKNIERVRVKISLPAVETITGSNAQGYTAAPKLAYTVAFVGDFILPFRATEQQRLDLIKYVKTVFVDAQISDPLFYGNYPY